MRRIPQCWSVGLMSLLLLLAPLAVVGWTGTTGVPAYVSQSAPKTVFVRLAVTHNVSLTAPGSDFHNLTAEPNDRLLLTAQTAVTENGPYVWTSSASPLVRAPDMDESKEFLKGTLFTVAEGVGAPQVWSYVGPTHPTLGVTPLLFATHEASISCGTPGGPICADAETNTMAIEHLPTPVTLLGDPPPGICRSATDWYIDTTAIVPETAIPRARLCLCPQETNSNPICTDWASVSQFLDDQGNARTIAEGDNGTVMIATGAGVRCTVSGTAPNILYTCKHYFAGQAAGDLAYFNGTDWVRLPKDVGKFLRSDASAVSWQTPAGGGGGTGGSTIIFGSASITGVPCQTTPGTVSYLTYGAADPTESESQAYWRTPGTFTSIQGKLYGAAVGTDVTATLRVGGSDTALSCNVAGTGALLCPADTGSVAVAAGQFVSIGLHCTGTSSGFTGPLFSLSFEPS